MKYPALAPEDNLVMRDDKVFQSSKFLFHNFINDELSAFIITLREFIHGFVAFIVVIQILEKLLEIFSMVFIIN